MIWIYLRDYTDVLKKRVRFLHVGPEFCLRRILPDHRNLDYISIDLYKDSAMARMDLTRLSFPDNSFDALLCSHVLEHIPDDRRALQELFRVLKPGGWAIVNVPIEGETTLEDPSVRTAQERVRRYGDEEHVRSYGRDYPERLSHAGFQVTVVDFSDRLSADEIDRCRLRADNWPMEVLHIGFKHDVPKQPSLRAACGPPAMAHAPIVGRHCKSEKRRGGMRLPDHRQSPADPPRAGDRRTGPNVPPRAGKPLV